MSDKGLRSMGCCAAVLWFVASSGGVFADVSFDWATVGDPGNADVSLVGGPGPVGGVSYEYSISKYEVTNSQYTEFLNAVDPTGTNALELYISEMNTGMWQGVSVGGIDQNLAQPQGQRYAVKPGRANKPVNYVSLYDAIRFTN